MGWRDLLSALWGTVALRGGLFRRERAGERAALEAAIEALWHPPQQSIGPSVGGGDARGSACVGGPIVCLSARSGLDLALTKLAFPKGSEVLFVPGITIPAMLQVVESHGLRPVGVDPPSSLKLLPSSMEPYVTASTRVLVITQLFGAVYDVAELIADARGRGLFVIEDLAQSYIGPSAPAPLACAAGDAGAPGGAAAAGRSVRCHATVAAGGFRGHAEADLSLTSFGILKTTTALGGGVGWVRDPELREGMRALQATYPARSTVDFFMVVLKAWAFKIIAGPYFWGLVAAVVAAFGYDFDETVIGSVRGFPNPRDIRKRPALPLLRLLHRRLRGQLIDGVPCGRSVGSTAHSSSVMRRCEIGAAVARRLSGAGVEVMCQSAPFCSWWLVPVLVEDPQALVAGLQEHGFDATCSSTQLRAVPGSPAGAPAAVQVSSQDFMRRVVYLPVTPSLSQRAVGALVDAVLATVRGQGAPKGTRSKSGREEKRARVQRWLGLLVAAVALAMRPGSLLWCLPSLRAVWRLSASALLLFAIVAAVARRLAADAQLKIDDDVLAAMRPKKRAEGVAFWRAQPLPEGRIDGAVLVTGATGFVGGGVLFGLLARARELRISKIVLLIRKRSGAAGDERLAELRSNPAFEGVRDLFDELVVALEGDVAEPDFGWGDSERPWPHEESLKAVLHCAGDVRFDRPLQQAALSIISASLQVAQLSARWGASRFVFVSTAFVHAVPSANDHLQERLVELRDLDPMELYRDAVSHGTWAETAMRELGFPNTYTFTKAIAEHLVLQACDAAGIHGHIVRPSIVCPAWAAPFAGWAGDKPTTIVAGSALLTGGAVRVFRGSTHPCPAVPVDLVAGMILDAMVGTGASGRKQISHAAVDASQADWMLSFFQMTQTLLQVLALRGDMTLPEAGALLRFLRWAQNATLFWILDFLVNRLPISLATSACSMCCCVACLIGFGVDVWTARLSKMRMICRYGQLPAQYSPYSSPHFAWRFQSRLRLPSDWSPLEYTMLIHRAAVAFVRGVAPEGPSLAAAREFAELQVLVRRPLWADALVTFCMPGAPLVHCLAAIALRRALKWMDLRVTLDAASLRSLMRVAEPLVLCPTHRSLLDFVIIGLTCFQMRPLVPALRLPHVAADAEFAGLPVLGRVLSALGAFFVRRGSGGVQPDPALRAEVGRVFSRRRPLEVFLEGGRSRGRRQLRLRTGLLRALRDVAQQNVALVPMAISYELLPEDPSFYDEIRGLPRAPLRTMGLVRWALRGLCGDLPSYGDVHVRFGAPRVMDSSSDLGELLSGVQAEMVGLTTITTLHVRALSEVVGLTCVEVVEALQRLGLEPFESRIDHSADTADLGDAHRWPLALQAAALLGDRLPKQWALWLVEPVLPSKSGDDALSRHDPLCRDSSAPASASAADAVPPAVAALTALLRDAEEVAERAERRLREGGIGIITEEHLLQQLLHGEDGEPALPPPLARGAAHIVAARTAPPVAAAAADAGAPDVASEPAGPSTGPKRAGLPKSSAHVQVLWPAALQRRAERMVDREALDRWGFSDTRFAAQWVDGRPAVQITSKRYAALGGQPLFKLWEFMQAELRVSLNVRDRLPELPLPELPPPPDGLVERLLAALPEARVAADAESRLRAGTGHGLSDIWRLRTRDTTRRVFDAVVRPESEDEVHAILKAASAMPGFAVIPVGGRTNVTSATACPPREVDPRPFVALDMRGMSRVLWVNMEDGVACIEAGITGVALKETLQQHGVTMGMEPDSMEFSTLGGWIATRASGMKRARYGNIEDMLVEARVATPGGMLWQHGGDSGGPSGPSPSPSSSASRRTAFGRTSTNSALSGLVLGSEGCLGVVTSAIVRVKPLAEAVEYQSVLFTDWESGAAWMRDVGRLPAALRPASCRLMDCKQLQLSRAIRGSSSGAVKGALEAAALRLRGFRLETAAAATLVFEGSRAEVDVQKRVLAPLVRRAGGMWGGGSSGEAGYALTFAIAYLRDFCLDHRMLCESMETLVPWSSVAKVWPAVVAAVEQEHRALHLPGMPFLSCRMTQLYDEGAVLYMYMAIYTGGLSPESALNAFERTEHAARAAVLAAGGCLSHHHGVGKLRAPFLAKTQSSAFTAALRKFKESVDPHNVLGARNGAWASAFQEAGCDGADSAAVSVNGVDGRCC